MSRRTTTPRRERLGRRHRPDPAPRGLRTGPAAVERRSPYVVLGLVVALAVVLVPVVRYLLIPGETRTAAAALRDAPAYVAPGAGDLLDVDRARQVIGDRPILVAAFPASYGKGRLDVCTDIARILPSNLVLTYVGPASPGICTGDDFTEPSTGKANSLGSKTDNWVFRLSIAADRASQFRVSDDVPDRTPEVEELVLAFDAAVARDYRDGVPRREATAGAVTWASVLLRLVGLAVGLVVLFLLLRVLAVRLRDRVHERQQLRERRLALDAELSRIAEQVLRPRRSGSMGEASALYVQALTAFEGARSSEQMDAAEEAVRRTVAAAGS